MELLEHQLDGVAFLASSQGALLGDQMGLGKTAQAIRAPQDVWRKEGGSALVVCPSFLTANWISELEAWAPELSVRLVEGDHLDRHYTYLLPVAVKVTSYESIRIDSWALREAGARHNIVVLDEAQRIKNRNSQTHLAAVLLRRTRSWALTGTPIENSLTDVRSIAEFLFPGITLSRNLEEIAAQLKKHILKRTRVEVFGDEPRTFVRTLRLALGPRQQAAYSRILDDVRGRAIASLTPASLFAIINRLKQACNYEPGGAESAKATALKEILNNVAAEGGKAVVFSQYVRTLKQLEAELDNVLGILHGGMSNGDRTKLVGQFGVSRAGSVLLVSLHAGGVGINLPDATHVVMFDRWWNPAVEAQAVARALRFRRTLPLTVTNLIVAGSIEERIETILLAKASEAADFDARLQSPPLISLGDLRSALVERL